MRVNVRLLGALVTAVVLTAGGGARAQNTVLPCNSFCQSWMGFGRSEGRRIEETPAEQTAQPAPVAAESAPQDDGPPAAQSRAKLKL